ncbi:MAG: Gfo/Idh/MocA family oxidoreductase [Saprospiraceae bacterium]|nr:Gfo/Idh/MocA family oxidoreductase [Saprospiraceae bacterium]
MLKPKTLLLSLISSLLTVFGYGQNKSNQTPLRIGVAGLTHTHVHWILGREDRGDIEIVGIAEPNRALAERFAKQHGFSMDIVFPSLEEMLDKTNPEAVTAFNSTFEHLETVEICAPRGIHVMVEKPLAVSSKHAQKMAALARQHKIQLLTNYETTWYATNHKAYELVHEKKHIGPIRKMVIHDGHQGPKEIGVNQEFLDWLTDPVLNGGGAVTDFGCYGANLMTWLMKGQRPNSVSATLQTIKPEVYPKVDDEATIVLSYPEAQGIIQASWNWPYSRKDTEIYGKEGYIIAENRSQMRSRPTEKAKEVSEKLAERPNPINDPFAYLAAVVQGRLQPEPYDLSSLENNLIVVEILDAAKKSAKKGKVVKLK